MATTVVRDNKQIPPEEVAKRVVCLRLSFSSFGVRRKVDPKTVVTRPTEALKADAADSLHVGKDILQGECLREVRALTGEVRAFAIQKSVPARFLRGGMYLQSAAMLESLEQSLQQFQTKHALLVDNVLRRYEDQGPGGLIAQAQARLEPIGLFDPKDYPAPSAVRSSYAMKWQWLEFAVPDRLKEINPALWEQEKEKAAAMWREAAAEIRGGLRDQLADLVRRLMLRLEPSEDGKKKALRADAFDAVQDFLSSFPFRDVTSDSDLGREVERLRGILRATDISDLKRYEGLRASLNTQFAPVASRLEELVEEAPLRRISFGSEEEE
jgi:hypothetical protein